MPFEVIIVGDPPYDLRCMNCGAVAIRLSDDCMGNECKSVGTPVEERLGDKPVEPEFESPDDA